MGSFSTASAAQRSTSGVGSRPARYRLAQEESMLGNCSTPHVWKAQERGRTDDGTAIGTLDAMLSTTNDPDHSYVCDARIESDR